MIGLVQQLKAKIPDPHAHVYVLELLRDLHAGKVHLPPTTRSEIHAELERTAREEL